jgi:pterin-4a-carbinolamine dehydratase
MRKWAKKCLAGTIDARRIDRFGVAILPPRGLEGEHPMSAVLSKPDAPSTPAPHPAVPPGRPTQKLKAERVELLLARMPAWQLSPDGSSIFRDFELGSQREAVHFAQLACQWAAPRFGEPWFSVSRKRFSALLTTPAVDGVTEADFAFARKLDLWVGWLEAGRKGKAAG